LNAKREADLFEEDGIMSFETGCKARDWRYLAEVIYIENHNPLLPPMTIDLAKLDRVGSHARELGAAIGPRLRELDAILADDPELTDETAASILLYCAVAFVVATEGRGAALQRLAHMVEAAGSDLVEPLSY
jgi:hypothetical protein